MRTLQAVYPNQPILWEVAKHCTVHSYWSWQYLIFGGRYSSGYARISKNLVSYDVWLYFMLRYGSLEIPFLTQEFLLWCRSLRSLFHTYTLFCRANIIVSCVTQPKIARIISMVSGVLWWQYATYASSCIITKASRGYHMRCAHFVRQIFGGCLTPRTA